MIVASDHAVTGLDAAKKAAGSAAALAKRLDISGAAISRWGGIVPLKWLLDVELATGIPRYVLRPDLFASQPSAKKGRAA